MKKQTLNIIVGICIGSLVTFIVATVVFLIARRKQKKQQEYIEINNNPPQLYSKNMPKTGPFIPDGNPIGPNALSRPTKCVSCERELPSQEQWKGEPTKCFSCEQQVIQPYIT